MRAGAREPQALAQQIAQGGDRAELAPKASFRQVPQPRLARVLLAAAMILGAIAWVLVRLVRKR